MSAARSEFMNRGKNEEGLTRVYTEDIATNTSKEMIHRGVPVNTSGDKLKQPSRLHEIM